MNPSKIAKKYKYLDLIFENCPFKKGIFRSLANFKVKNLFSNSKKILIKSTEF
jgi:hypothetical protein